MDESTKQKEKDQKKFLLTRKQKDDHLFFYSKKESGTQQRLFLERIVFCDLRKQSSTTTTPCPQVFIQKFYLNKELRIYFPYKLTGW